MKILNSPYVAIIALTLVIWIAYYSRHEEAAYTHSSFSVLDNPKRWALMDIWNITDADLHAKVNIFGERL